ncbi:MAG: dihydropteroate synthase [Coriobacteriia bacterium]|nr:dihydropteroate synthase [Coriobacteriia bacterium]
MGAVNVTPDSFSDGGTHADTDSAVEHARLLLGQGAAILDIGGESTRPGAGQVTVAEELSRVLPVIKRLAGCGVPISADTRHATVAHEALAGGASIINDVGGFCDPKMREVAASSKAGLVVMHMQGMPETMQAEPVYDDVAAEVSGFLLRQAALLEEMGVARERIVIDPGLGFGKTLEHNLLLLAAVPELASHGYPVLIGASRKGFIGRITGESTPALRLGGSIAAALESARLGARILRAHDVAETVQALQVAAEIAKRSAESLPDAGQVPSVDQGQVPSDVIGHP